MAIISPKPVTSVPATEIPTVESFQVKPPSVDLAVPPLPPAFPPVFPDHVHGMMTSVPTILGQKLPHLAPPGGWLASTGLVQVVPADQMLNVSAN